MIEPSKKPQKMSGCLIAILIFTIMFVTGIVVFYFALWRVPDNSVEAARLKNEAQTRLENAMAVPKDQNAWSFYKEAYEKSKQTVIGADKLPEKAAHFYNEGITPKTEPIIKKLMDIDKVSLELSAKAYKRKHFQVPMDFRQGHVAKAPNFLAVRDLAFFLTLVADYNAKKGKNREAAERYLQGLYLGQGIGRNVFLIFGMINIAIDNIILDHLKIFVADSDCDAEVYKYILNEMKWIYKDHATYRSMILYEMLYSHYTFQLMKSGKLGGGKASSQPLQWGFFIDREEQICDNATIEAMNSTSLKYEDAIRKMGGILPGLPTLTIIPKIIVPNYVGGYKQYIRRQVLYEGTMILAALRWYEKEKGDYPEDLSQLVPDYMEKLPEDPYTKDGRFIYKRDGDKIIFYSIGDDQKDDGGKVESKKMGEPGDIIFMK